MLAIGLQKLAFCLKNYNVWFEEWEKNLNITE